MDWCYFSFICHTIQTFSLFFSFTGAILYRKRSSPQVTVTSSFLGGRVPFFLLLLLRVFFISSKRLWTISTRKGVMKSALAEHEWFLKLFVWISVRPRP